MRNPFDFQKSDDEFVAAAQTQQGRRTHILKLTYARSFAMVTLAIAMGFAGLLFVLDPRAFMADSSFLLWPLAFMLPGCLHLDLQIKFLKAAEEQAKEPVEVGV